MAIKILLRNVNIAILATSVTVLILLWRKRLTEDFRYFMWLVISRVLVMAICIPLLFFRKTLHIPATPAYATYYYTLHGSYFVDMVLQVLTIYAIYRLAMRGLEGLQRIGQILFRWIAGVSFGISIFFAIGPHTNSDYRAVLISQIHQGVSVLSLCLLLFVCLALRPLGLTFRSYIFGVSLGLGLTSATSLVEAAWLPTASGHAMYSPMFFVTALSPLVAVLTWAAYFVFPEPERKMVLLPTTSPFFVWNSISEALGDEPGQVAISGFTPDMLSQAELDELGRSAHREPKPEEDSDDHDDDGPSGALQRALTSQSFFPS